MTAKAKVRALTDDELLIIRVFDAPVKLVFRIWEKAEHIIHWLGPENFTCAKLEYDFRPGGKWRARIDSEAYGESWMGGEFREIEKYKRIIYSFAWEDRRDQPRMDTLVTVTFEEQDGKTIQRFHQTPFSNVEDRDSHVGGWNSCFNREQTYVENLARGNLR